MHLCIAGWMEGGRVGYPTTIPSPRCGDSHVGVVLYKEPVPPSSKYDAYCYRETDVSCVCNSGYVGDGTFCNGVVINVLATNTNYSLFYKFILGYSGSSVKGRELLDFLSSGGSDVMLFVPHNDGFLTNQTLSGRDLEYHVSANHSRRLYQDLRHQEVVHTWLGANLTVTHGNNQSNKLVNQQLLLDWDVPAMNGIIHVIQAPLQAPPPQVCSPTQPESNQSDSGQVAREVIHTGLEEREQRESKEDKREDSRVEEASSVDRRENCSGDGSEDRTDEARVEGERGVTWENFGRLNTSLAAAFWIRCKGLIAEAGSPARSELQ
ncbi:Stabilin-2 [Merluccius polli]|uniref:Stabilin-2 n=1 Tax=Merluccius polli TaxID=89951 RepID=A0AA47MZ21_MERPO|nr:Stabilin-2 [Merluccius polli]